MTIKGILMAGAAVCTVAAAPAFAKSAPQISVVALHGGQAVAKSAMHINATNVTYTFSVYTGISTKAGYNVPTNLAQTFYTFQSNGSICDAPKKESIKLSATKTVYASLSTGTETYSEGCSAPTVFYGDIYDLTSKKAKNKTDTFSSTLSAKFTSGGTKYNGKLILDISVAITK